MPFFNPNHNWVHGRPRDFTTRMIHGGSLPWDLRKSIAVFTGKIKGALPWILTASPLPFPSLDFETHEARAPHFGGLDRSSAPCGFRQIERIFRYEFADRRVTKPSIADF